MKKIVILALIAFSAVTATAGVEAFGARGGFSSAPGQIILGGHAQVHDLSPEAKIIPNVELGFGDGVTIFSVNGAVHYSFLSSNMSGFTPYAGGELGYNNWSYDTNSYYNVGTSGIVINALAGLKKKMNEQQELSFELKLGLSNLSHDIKILAGLTFF
jgi:hypothetical protein